MAKAAMATMVTTPMTCMKSTFSVHCTVQHSFQLSGRSLILQFVNETKYKSRKIQYVTSQHALCAWGPWWRSGEQRLRMVKAHANVDFRGIFGLSFILSASIEDEVHVIT